MHALIVKEFRELRRDHRTLAMLIVLPVLLLVIFGYAANFSVDRVSVIVVGPKAKAVADKLDGYDVAASNLDVIRIDTSLQQSDAEQLLRDQRADVVVTTKDNPGEPFAEQMHIYIDGSSLFTAQAAKSMFMQLATEATHNRIANARSTVDTTLAEVKQVSPAPTGFSETTTLPLNPDNLVTVLFNPDVKTSWVMVPALIGLILLFIGVLITSIGLVRERESGTLEQLAVMPLRPSAIILGKIIPYFLLALVDMAIVTALGIWLFGVPFAGSLWLFSLAAVVFLFGVLGIGVLISSASQSTGQAIQMAILFVVPQVLLSGLIFPLDSMPISVRWIGYLLPLTWFRELTQGVMLRGGTLESLWLPLLILIAMAILAFGAATARMRFLLTHGGERQ